MLFNSFQFAIFLPIVFIIYWFILNKNLKLQNLFILIASYVFYGWWDWRFLILIGFTSLCSYLSGIFIDSSHSEKLRKLISVSNIVVNLIILGFFKYFNFFIESLVDLLNLFGVQPHISTLKIILPVGISFYTFQALSYSIDVYKRKVNSTKDIVSFFAFISFFPLLIAGPIERATNFLPQFFVKRTFKYEQAVDGMRQILWGLFKKIVIADSSALIVNYVFNNYETLPGSWLLLGGIFFAFQIYGDFSGYSDMAIGLSRLFGFNAMRNFAYPYFSRDIAEFWRRWHISLSTWFRDYVYIPMGGSRGTKYETVRNTLVMFLVSGFWHGANWTFIAWGLFNGLLFLPLLIGNRNKKYKNIVAENSFFPSLKEFIQMLTTFFLVVMGWIFFRSENIGQAIHYIKRIFSSSFFSFEKLPGFSSFFIVSVVFYILVLLIVEWIQRKKQYGLQIDDIRLLLLRWIIYLVLMIVIFSFYPFLTGQSPFIYFQF